MKKLQRRKNALAVPLGPLLGTLLLAALCLFTARRTLDLPIRWTVSLAIRQEELLLSRARGHGDRIFGVKSSTAAVDVTLDPRTRKPAFPLERTARSVCGVRRRRSAIGGRVGDCELTGVDGHDWERDNISDTMTLASVPTASLWATTNQYVTVSGNAGINVTVAASDVGAAQANDDGSRFAAVATCMVNLNASTFSDGSRFLRAWSTYCSHGE